jgi:hypothetical protein
MVAPVFSLSRLPPSEAHRLAERFNGAALFHDVRQTL